MKVAIIGTGYVGLPTGVGLASLGHNVVCIDREKTKINKLQNGQVTLYEDGLGELLQENLKKETIHFTTSMEKGIADAALVIIAVGTPPHPVTHEADLKYLYAAATELAPFLKNYTVVATKSTVPVGTGDSIESLIKKTNKNADFDVVSLPEFLREGFAVKDFFKPDRIIIGSNSERALQVLTNLYQPLIQKHPTTKLLTVSRRSSETIKYASNSFLATKIHFINEIADFCEKVDANIYEVAQGIGLDHRIGSSFLNPGPGFGGSCFPKDTLALDFMARQNQLNLSVVQATIKGNQARIKAMAQRIINSLPKLDQGEQKVIGVLGLAFKQGTDDCRESPAMQIVQEIIASTSNLTLRLYDPQALNNAKELLMTNLNNLYFCNNIDEVSCNADVLCILTEWEQFAEIDLVKTKEQMRHLNIVDCRNMLYKQRATLHSLGFNYQGVGFI